MLWIDWRIGGPVAAVTATLHRLQSQGRATIYVGGTVTYPRDPNGATILKKPVFTVVYN